VRAAINALKKSKQITLKNNMFKLDPTDLAVIAAMKIISNLHYVAKYKYAIYENMRNMQFSRALVNGKMFRMHIK
jgi:hypothetical protein